LGRRPYRPLGAAVYAAARRVDECARPRVAKTGAGPAVRREMGDWLTHRNATPNPSPLPIRHASRGMRQTPWP